MDLCASHFFHLFCVSHNLFLFPFFFTRKRRYVEAGRTQTMSASALRVSAGRVATRATAVLSAESIKIVKTVFIPRAEELTKHFYAKMSKNNPEVLAFFNQANQKKERGQPQALAQAIVAYASNIDTLGVLDSAVEAMAAKNCGLQVLPKVHSPRGFPRLIPPSSLRLSRNDSYFIFG